jgi:hypothetical protein
MPIRRLEMTVMLLAMLLSDAAANASDADDYTLAQDYGGGGGSAVAQQIAAPVRGRAWTPRVDWTPSKTECPAFFSREIKGFGVFRVGPTCAEEDVPHAL